jgi:hypothetical protein
VLKKRRKAAINEGAHALKCVHIMKSYNTPFISIDSPVTSEDKVSYRNIFGPH